MKDQGSLVKIEWRLYQVMAEKNIRTAVELKRRLDAVGVHITSVHLSRLVAAPPKKLSMDLLAGFVTVLGCSPNDLLRVAAPDDVSSGPGANPPGTLKFPDKRKSAPGSNTPGGNGPVDKLTGPEFKSFIPPRKRR